jgi:hypothetical protein
MVNAKDASAGKTVHHGLGWVPDLPDQRDKLYGVVRPLPAKPPPSVDLRPLCSQVEDQGDLGSCTGNALAGAVELLEKKDKVPFTNVSRLFIYYNERVIEHSVHQDSGAMLRDGIKTLVKQGVCSEAKWPYVISKFAVKPSLQCYKEALNHQVTVYARLQTVDEMRACLAEHSDRVRGALRLAVAKSTPRPGRRRRRLKTRQVTSAASRWVSAGSRSGAWLAASRRHAAGGRQSLRRTALLPGDRS